MLNKKDLIYLELESHDPVNISLKITIKCPRYIDIRTIRINNKNFVGLANYQFGSELSDLIKDLFNSSEGFREFFMLNSINNSDELKSIISRFKNDSKLKPFASRLELFSSKYFDPNFTFSGYRKIS
jgi:hypothetical protein